MPNDAASGANAVVSCLTYSACSISMVRARRPSPLPTALLRPVQPSNRWRQVLGSVSAALHVPDGISHRCCGRAGVGEQGCAVQGALGCCRDHFA